MISSTVSDAVFERLESQVRSYCRGWPVVFDRATGCALYDQSGREYLDFFAGAGALNYGHNDPVIKQSVLDYIARDGVTHALDMYTVAKRDFLETLHELVLLPRDLDYKVMFPGPAGATAVEAALKLARKVTGRTGVVCFSNGFHGMTLGALAVTGNAAKRRGAGVPLEHTTPWPFDNGGDGHGVADLAVLEHMLTDPGSGLDRPAAVIVETVQGEGGLDAARAEWLRELADLCSRQGVLLVVDDVQMGCGRTGPFFSFEFAGITPDIVCLSKSIGGFGLPLSLVLCKPEWDVWEPGEHNGTFRGVSPAFVAATTALREYWSDDALEKHTVARGEQLERGLADIVHSHPAVPLEVKGRGLARGLRFPEGAHAEQVAHAAFERGLLVETAGAAGDVVKLMPPLVVSEAEAERGLMILDRSVRDVLAEISLTAPGSPGR